MGRRVVEQADQDQPATDDDYRDGRHRDEEHDLAAPRRAVGMADDLPALVLPHRVDGGRLMCLGLLGCLELVELGDVRGARRRTAGGA
jgi:hypothetical protein